MTLYNTWTAVLGSATSISNIQSVTISVGRETPADQWPVSTAEIVVWYPTGYGSPLANLTIGRTIRIMAPGRTSGNPTWCGIVKDVTIDVGIPWDSATSTGNGDFLRIACEGYGAVLGRYDQITYLVGGPSVTPNSLFNDLVSQYGVNMGWTNNSGWASDAENTWDPPATYVFQPWTVLQQIAVLTDSKICDGLNLAAASGSGTSTPAILMSDPYLKDNQSTANWKRIAPTSFSDTTNNATNRIYDQLMFDSLGDNYYTQATISDQNADYTASVGSAPYRTLYTQGPQQDSATYAANYSGQAQRLATMFSVPEIAISSISATTANQDTQNLDTLGLLNDPGNAAMLGSLPIHSVNVTFRGTTYLCQIEGVTVSADVEQTRYTYYVSPADLTNYFRLNDTNFGILDSNRLTRYSP